MPHCPGDNPADLPYPELPDATRQLDSRIRQARARIRPSPAARLRDRRCLAEIVGYVQKFRHKFKTADGPAQFMRSVRGSGKTGANRTIDLLRAPLVLAMAVGLYAHRPTRIPNTIAKLYQAMIEEMLERHGFKQEAPKIACSATG